MIFQIFCGPIQLRDSAGDVVLGIDGDFRQGDGPPMSVNLAGVPYETFVWTYESKPNEDENIGRDAVTAAFKSWAEYVTSKADLYSLEWRVRPTLRAELATVGSACEHNDSTTHATKMVSVMRFEVYCRVIQHMKPAT